MNASADRHLLFGLLALQNGIINQGQLVAAFQAWTLDKSKSLADHLESRGNLTAATRALLEALAEVHLEAHDGDVDKSLAAVSPGKSTKESLARIGDPEIEASLGPVGSAHGSTQNDDEDRTTSYAVGSVTSDGQRFHVLRPHAQGGLGAVFVALDSELHREVALKQILDRHADDPVSRQRFLAEAEITGGLEHPGIVPVYGLGSYGDGRPYYAMRFIRGGSLKEDIQRFHADAAMKNDPSRRSLELRKLLRRFTDVCNAIAYAHSRGVLHRDIKPGNIIVGKHGETLVVDWGLAKASGMVDATQSAEERPLVPSSASGSAETLPGSALGTPGYMSPEQARGELDGLGPRSDVYSLGATLFCLLTGKPPFENEDIGAMLRAVEQGEFPPPRQLEPTIDAALEAVCLKAMARKPENRYDSPKALAGDIERWMADEPVGAWREPMTRRARRWARRHQTAVTGTAVALLTGLIGLAAVSAISFQHRQAQALRLELALRDAYLKRKQAQDPATGDPAKWHAALTAVDRAVVLLGPLSNPWSRREVLALREEVAAAAEAADRDSTLLNTVIEIRASKAEDSFGEVGDETCAWVFHQAGLDIDELEPDAAAAQIRTRPAGVIPMLTGALDDWAARRRKARPKDIESLRRLIAVARAADPDETRNRLRAVWLQSEGKAQREPLLALAKEADPGQWPVQTLTLLATALLDADEPAAAAKLLDRAQAHDPGDVWINHTLGRCLERVQPPRLDDAIRFYTAARALRPDTAHDLAHALHRRGQDDEALAVFQDLTERNPDIGRHWACMATLQEGMEDHAGAWVALGRADDIFRRTLHRRPDDVATHVNLAGVLGSVAHNYLAAAIEYRAALTRDPENAQAHFGLGNALRGQGKLDEAAASYRAAIRIRPEFGPAHNNLGYILLRQGNVDGAIAEGRESLRLEPDAAAAPGFLAWLLAVYPDRPARDYEEAATLVRKSLELQPKVPMVHHSLALVEYRRGHWDASIAAAERAMALKKGGRPNDWFLLAMALARKGEKQKAVEWYDKAAEETRRLKMTVDDVLLLWSEAARLLGRPGPPSEAGSILPGQRK